MCGISSSLDESPVCFGRNIYLTSVFDVRVAPGMRCAGEVCFAPSGLDSRGALSLRGLILNPAADQGYDCPHQQERNEAGYTSEADLLAQIEGGVSSGGFGRQQH